MANLEVPRFILPDNKQYLWKFIQFDVEGEPFFRYKETAPNNPSEHRNILLDALSELGVKADFTGTGISRTILKKGQDYEIAGAGFMNYSNRSQKKYFLYDESSYFWLKPNQDHLDRLTPYIPPEIKIVIENPFER
ncbi:MAG: hypothetical protein WAU65_02800 [Candidatus Nanoarchaeia archaeon]